MRGKKYITFLVIMVGMLFVLDTLATAQMPLCAYHILHKTGAIYNSDTGWNLNCPPYYANTDWAVDFVYNSQGVSILHKDGAIWNSSDGWILTTPPYYSGSNYARALEFVPDITGCWVVNSYEFETVWVNEADLYGLDYEYYGTGNEYVLISTQEGKRVYGEHQIYYDGTWHHENMEGSINGDQFTFVFTSGDKITTSTGLVFWNETHQRWEAKGSYVSTESQWGSFGSFHAWLGNGCR